MNKKLFTAEIFPNRILGCVFSLSQKEQAGPIKALISNLEGFFGGRKVGNSSVLLVSGGS